MMITGGMRLGVMNAPTRLLISIKTPHFAVIRTDQYLKKKKRMRILKKNLNRV